jgi:hypothetical protein
MLSNCHVLTFNQIALMKGLHPNSCRKGILLKMFTFVSCHARYNTLYMVIGSTTYLINHAKYNIINRTNISDCLFSEHVRGTCFDQLISKA